MLQLRTVIDMYVSGQMRVALLVDLHHSIEKFVNSLARTADSRHYRHTEKVA